MVYQNGVAGVWGGTTSPALTDVNFYFGYLVGLGDRYYDGTMDELSVYDNKLSVADIQADYAAGLAAMIPEPATLAVLGLGGLFGGAGSALGHYLEPDPEVTGLWPLGLIPIFIGIGLLLFVRLSRGFADKMNGS